MPYNENGTIALFVEDRRWSREEKQIRIEVGNLTHFRPIPENMKNQRRGTSEEVFDTGTGVFCVQELLVSSLKIR